ncbi:hypothetical protein R1sor_006572 [Riccia sorocarpa]|uniref:Uncharacterized protein n=1 Tax=Riccia sorocarpa TaxID=122646 RepID=A0ABD3HS23_9MARC
MTSSSRPQKKKKPPLTRSRSDEDAGVSNNTRATILSDIHPRLDEGVCSNQEDSLTTAVPTICEGGEASWCSKRPRVTTADVDGGGEQEVESPERSSRIGAPHSGSEGRRVEIPSSADSVNQGSGKGKGLFQEPTEQVANVPSGLSRVPKVGTSRSSVRSTVRSRSSSGVITCVVEVMESAVELRGSCSINARAKSAASSLKLEMSSVFADPGLTVREDIDELISTASFHRVSDDADEDDSDNDAASTCLQYMQRVETLESEVGSSNIPTIGFGELERLAQEVLKLSSEDLAVRIYIFVKHLLVKEMV